MRALVGFATILGLTIAVQAASPQRPFYVVVGDVTQPDGQLSSEVKQLFVERLRQRPDVTLEAPAWLPEDQGAMRVALHSHGMRAYNASMKIESAKTELLPMPQDPSHATLTYSARVRIFGFTLPDRELKIGGEGEAESSLVIGVANADAARERLSRQVLDTAMQEAMAATVEKIRIVALRERAMR